MLYYLRKAQPGPPWLRLTKDKAKVGHTHKSKKLSIKNKYYKMSHNCGMPNRVGLKFNSFFFFLSQLSWLSVDFNNWKDYEDDSDEEMGNSSQFSDVSKMFKIMLKKAFLM